MFKRRPLCAACGGTLIYDHIRYDKRFGDEVAVFEDVPANVCPQCGATWIDGKTVEKIERTFRFHKKPSYKITVPVWTLKKAA